eukprot:COSAG02_NODE_274_length_26244_cov_36.943507_6_plen_304_part_00
MGVHQTNIRFRQLEQELLWDESKRTAMAKWEAAFDKRRHDGTTRPCHFVQVAVLRFTPLGKIEFLEEYWHSTTKQKRHDDAAVVVPASAVVLAQQAPAQTAAPITPEREPTATVPGGQTFSCTVCGCTFATRNKLFVHLRGVPGGPGTCIAADAQLAGTISKKRERMALVVAYIGAVATDMPSAIATAWAAFTGEPCSDMSLRVSSAAAEFLTSDSVGVIGDVLSLSVSHSVATMLLERWARPGDMGGRSGLRQEAVVEFNQKLREALAGMGHDDECNSIQCCLNLVGPCSRDFDAKKSCERR